MSDQVEPLEPQIDLAPASWPKVVGIISICWASLGLGCMTCGIGSLFLFSGMLPPEVKDNPPPTMKFGTLQAIQTVLALVLGVLLISAGVQTIRRQLAGRTLHLVWAAATLLGNVYGAYVGWVQQTEMSQWIRDNPSSPMAKGGDHPALGLAIVAVMIAVFSIWPVFCLIWFGLVKRTKASFGTPPNADYI